MNNLGVFRLHNDIVFPSFATKQSACFDLMCQTAGKREYTIYTQSNKMKSRPLFDLAGKKHPLHVGPGERVSIPTGLIFDIPEGYSLRIHSRSGLSLKSGLILVNGEGIVDSDYVEEVMLLMINVSSVGISIEERDRIAQAELVQNQSYAFNTLTERPLQKTNRTGGLGSTGINIEYAKNEEHKKTPNKKRPRGRPRLNRN